MTRVFCEFKECIYNKDDECTKDDIWLDENVSNIDIGCPDAVWEVEGRYCNWSERKGGGEE